MKQAKYTKQTTSEQSWPNMNTREAEPVSLVQFGQTIIIFIFVDVVFIKRIFGICLLVVLMENVASIFTSRNYLQQVTGEEQVLLS